MKAAIVAVAAAILSAPPSGAQLRARFSANEVRVGGVRIRPSGFFEYVEMLRSATTPDSISTRFGRIPLIETPHEWIDTPRHSRWMARADRALGPFNLSGYTESDFMDFRAGASSHRWRHYYGQARFGGWEILGGQTWSLLRPNKAGLSPERDIMSPSAIEPNHAVGFIGGRRRQLRAVRSFWRHYKTAVAWELGNNITAKVTRDVENVHLEVAGAAGPRGRRALSLAGSARVSGNLRIVMQQYLASNNLDEALGVVSAGRSGFATMYGAEIPLSRSFEVYGYAGLVSAARAADNRVVREWTVGFNRQAALPGALGRLLFSSQFAYVDRKTWDGKRGGMSYWMTRLRYAFN